MPPLLLALLLAPAAALHADEAGLTDFVLRTAGHGDAGVRYAKLASTSHSPGGERVWVTSQSEGCPAAIIDGSNDGGEGGKSSGRGDGGLARGKSGSEDYCSVAARNVTTGDVLWRVDACSASAPKSRISSGGSREFVPRHATLASVYLTVFSLDNTGILRGWNAADGQLVLDTDLLSHIDSDSDQWAFPNGVPRLLDAQSAIGTVVAKRAKHGGTEEGDESLVLLDLGSGHPVKEEGYHHQPSRSLLSARALLQKAKVPSKKYGRARIVAMHRLDEARIGVWAAWSTDDEKGRAVGSFPSVAFAEVALTSKPSSEGRIVTVYQIVRAVPLSMADAAPVASTPMLLSSMKVVHHADGVTSLLAIAANDSQLLATTVDLSTAKARRGQVVEIDALHPYWRSVASIHVDNTRAVVDTHTLASEDGDYHVVRVAGADDRYPIVPRRTESLLLLDGDGKLSSGGGDSAIERVYGEEKNGDEIHQDALVYCADVGTVVAAMRNEDGQTVATALNVRAEDLTPGSRVHWSSREVEGDGLIAPSSSHGGVAHGLVKYAYLVECSKKGMTVVFTTLGGTTSAVRFDSNAGKLAVRQLWSMEEALGSISSAIFLDETHAVTSSDTGVSADDEEEEALRNLQFANRIQSQLSSLKNFFFGGGALSSLASMALMSEEKKAERDMAFGFAKISVMLSERLHRIVAIDTAKKGRVVWAMNLRAKASWHRLVRGGQFVALNDPHGNGGVHDHEMLALSYVEGSGGGSVEWQCFDGTTGRVFSSERVPAKTSVMQIVPLRTSVHHPHDANGCRQVALLVHSDRTVSVVPDTARSYTTVDEAMESAGPNGLFAHTINKETGEFLALRLARKSGSKLEPGSNPFEFSPVGVTTFDPSQERILQVTYPRRGEAVQSPSTVLGDDALLLKYLNPHLVVVVTEATPEHLAAVASVAEGGSNDGGDGFYNSLVGGGQYSGSSSSGPGQKRRPLGASKPGEETPGSSASNVVATPSLFVTLIDSVSGQILHRVSHAHALEADIIAGEASPTSVPVVISENWIVYAFSNQRTRRTDVGVLTLHEGMIDKNSMTAFSAPEQELEFSSLESAKPIVLSKTYGLARAVTALGATTTRAGISSRQFLFATGNGQVVSMDRRMLDPRRPSGDLKDSEKMEGLIRYGPLLPIIPLRTPSHVYEVSAVTAIASTSANVESQSLVLAHGGPDVFFTRIAPSKGFDLLPDDFNRALLSVVLVGLIVLLGVMQRMNGKKMVKTIWS